MTEWPELGTQALPTGMRLILLLASAAGALLIALALDLGFVGALLIALVLTPLTDFVFRRLTR